MNTSRYSPPEKNSPVMSYWGEADPKYPGSPKWHPLVYHCLDVAAVALEYLRRAPAQRQLFVSALGDDRGLDGWIAFWMAVRGRNSAKVIQRMVRECAR